MFFSISAHKLVSCNLCMFCYPQLAYQLRHDIQGTILTLHDRVTPYENQKHVKYFFVWRVSSLKFGTQVACIVASSKPFVISLSQQVLTRNTPKHRDTSWQKQIYVPKHIINESYELNNHQSASLYWCYTSHEWINESQMMFRHFDIFWWNRKKQKEFWYLDYKAFRKEQIFLHWVHSFSSL